MKTLKLKRSTTYVVYNALKRTPPKDFPDVDEMVVTVDEILPSLEKKIGEFIAFRKRADEIQIKQFKKELTTEETQSELEKLNLEVRAYEDKFGNEEVPIELENSAHTKFLTQFERWGKNWFNDLESYIAFKKALETETKTKSS